MVFEEARTSGERFGDNSGAREIVKIFKEHNVFNLVIGINAKFPKVRLVDRIIAENDLRIEINPESDVRVRDKNRTDIGKILRAFNNKGIGVEEEVIFDRIGTIISIFNNFTETRVINSVIKGLRVFTRLDNHIIEFGKFRADRRDNIKVLKVGVSNGDGVSEEEDFNITKTANSIDQFKKFSRFIREIAKVHGDKFIKDNRGNVRESNGFKMIRSREREREPCKRFINKEIIFMGIEREVLEVRVIDKVFKEREPSVVVFVAKPANKNELFTVPDEAKDSPFFKSISFTDTTATDNEVKEFVKG